MKKIILVLSISLLAFSVNAQINFHSNTVNDSENASAIGTNNTASGTTSFVSGHNSVASGSYSTAMGHSSTASGMHSVALGSFTTAEANGSVAIGPYAKVLNGADFSFAVGNLVETTASGNFVLGVASDYTHPLINNIANSFMIGFQSDIPTLFVGTSNGPGTFGKVGIGTTSPASLLDVNGTLNVEEMVTFRDNLDVASKTTTHQLKITDGASNGQVLSSDAEGNASWIDPDTFIPESIWSENNGNIYRESGNTGVGTDDPVEKFQIGDRWTFHNGGTKIIGYNYHYTASGSQRIVDGPASMIGYSSNGSISMKTAADGLASSTIESWNLGLYMGNNGNIGIGTTSPQSLLDITGKTTTQQLQITDGASAGRVLSSDADGNATWVDSGTIISDSPWVEDEGDVYLSDANGSVGIGTNNPTGKLHIDMGTDKPDIVFKSNFSGEPDAADMQFITDDTDEHLVFANYSNDWETTYKWQHGSGAGARDAMVLTCVPWDTKLAINLGHHRPGVIFDSQGSSDSTASDIKFITYANGGNTTFSTYTDNYAPIYKWQCGTDSIYPYTAMSLELASWGTKLRLHGNLLCEQVEVMENVPNSDFVFEEDYELMGLQELETFVNKNHHLPEIPSAAEFKENGYNMNDMDDLLLRKVEELTLYIIALEKKVDVLENNQK